MIRHIILAIRSFFDKTSDDIRQKVLKKLAGEKYRVLQNKSYNNRIYREKRNKEICKNILTGKNFKELAEEYNLTSEMIGKILRKNGIRFREEKRKTYKKLINKYLEQGISKVKTAKKLGISRQRLYQIMNEEGLK